MNPKQIKIEKSYFLFQKWWDSTKLTNYEKYVLNEEIINLNQQLLRLKEKTLRVGVYGKAGVGKSSILNDVLQEKFFKTGILNGSTNNFQSKYLSLKNSLIKTIELIDSPGFDICNITNQDQKINNILGLDLILFITAGDLNRKELDTLLKLIKYGKNITIILNKIDIWSKEETAILKNKIKEKLPLDIKIPIITYSSKINYVCKSNKILNYLNETLNEIGYSLLIYNTYQTANQLAINIKEKRLIKGREKAQAAIGKFATLKASSVAINPMLFIDIAGSATFDTLLIHELSKIYGLEIKGQSAVKLLKSLSLNNLFIGLTQIGINSSFNFIKKISLILAPFTSGLSLVPYGTVAIAQAAIAIQTTRLIGKLAAKEILEKSKTNNLEPFKNIQNIAFKESDILKSKKYLLFHQKCTKDYSIFIP